VVYDVLDELVPVEVTVPETTEEDVGPVVDEELDDDVTVPLFVLVEFVKLELEVEADETEDVLLDDDVTVPLFVLVEFVKLELEVEADETEDLLLDVLLVATGEELDELAAYHRAGRSAARCR
jgi:hypothetical protein